MTTGPLTMSTVLDWLEGRLEPDQAAQVEQAVAAGDSETRDLVAWAEEFLAASRAMPLVETPPELSQRLRDAFRLHHRPQEDSATARLTADSRVAAGMRVGATGTERQLVFETELGTVVIDLVESGDELDVEGSIARMVGQELVSVSCSRQGRAVRTAMADRRGQFALSEVPVDVDEFRLFSGGVSVRIPLPRG